MIVAKYYREAALGQCLVFCDAEDHTSPSL
jgi:hypothetical protein